MNFEKYRKADTIKLHGIYGDIYQESENGELIDSMRSKDAGFCIEDLEVEINTDGKDNIIDNWLEITKR